VTHLLDAAFGVAFVYMTEALLASAHFLCHILLLHALAVAGEGHQSDILLQASAFVALASSQDHSFTTTDMLCHDLSVLVAPASAEGVSHVSVDKSVATNAAPVHKVFAATANNMTHDALLTTFAATYI
jgi:hypothetical protein